ncbi:unnamed protein product [Effrenium voratum]|nr:unnamed protein product [Effrenium voratum]
MCLFLRNLPIATKYAYCSTETWMSHNTKHIEFKYRAFQNLLSGWYVIPQAPGKKSHGPIGEKRHFWVRPA